LAECWLSLPSMRRRGPSNPRFDAASANHRLQVALSARPVTIATRYPGISRGMQLQACSSGLKGRAMLAQGKTANGGRRPGSRVMRLAGSPIRAR
jgi:hypothetical protein